MPKYDLEPMRRDGVVDEKTERICHKKYLVFVGAVKN